jgi:hypothetical protein
LVISTRVDIDTIALIPPSAHVVPILLFDPRREHSSAPTATFGTLAGFIYNTTPRMGAPADGITGNIAGSAFGRAVSVHDFGGNQQVSGGTFTLTMPSNTSSAALLRIA